MPERIVDTAQGQVSYETVICQSCGDEIAKEGAKRCVIGDWNEETHLENIRVHKYEFSSRPDDGWLCDFCHENPAAYPHKDDKPDWHDKGRLFHLAKFVKG